MNKQQCFQVAEAILKAPHLERDSNQELRLLKNKKILFLLASPLSLESVAENARKENPESIVVLLSHFPNENWVGRTEVANRTIFLNLKYEVSRIALSFRHELKHLLPGGAGLAFEDPTSWQHLKLHGKSFCEGF